MESRCSFNTIQKATEKSEFMFLRDEAFLTHPFSVLIALTSSSCVRVLTVLLHSFLAVDWSLVTNPKPGYKDEISTSNLFPLLPLGLTKVSSKMGDTVKKCL